MQPCLLLTRWLKEAIARNVPKADAMCLATVGNDGPSSRMVLMDRVLADGITFCTDARSRKGQELALNPKASAVFYWPSISRQVRIEGTVEEAPVVFAEADFRKKSRQQQLLIRMCHQSASVRHTRLLKQSLDAAMACSVSSQECARPDHWRAFILRATRIEFFLGGHDRFNRRLALALGEDGRWTSTRLVP